jgi:hypothetical protein
MPSSGNRGTGSPVHDRRLSPRRAELGDGGFGFGFGFGWIVGRRDEQAELERMALNPIKFHV